jgi:hypothetical protein
MIELRWLVPVSGPTVLQYRQMVDKTNYGDAYTHAPIREWSEWRNVPVESERDPSYP